MAFGHAKQRYLVIASITPVEVSFIVIHTPTCPSTIDKQTPPPLACASIRARFYKDKVDIPKNVPTKSPTPHRSRM